MPTLAGFIEDSINNVPIEPIKLDNPVPVEALPTPALILDLDILEANLQRMQSYLTEHGMGLRCHTKMHKSPLVARMQIAMGAIGVCCATVSEAEVMAAAGIENILITSPVVTEEKLARVVAVGKKIPGLQIVVDYQQGASMLNQMAGNAGIQIGVLIDLDPGMGRTGITPGEPALALAKYITGECSNLKFGGLQMYIGNCMHIQGYEKRRDKYKHLLGKGISTRQLLEDNGIAVPVFTGGGTGTYDIEQEINALTDLQAGSYGCGIPGYWR